MFRKYAMNFTQLELVSVHPETLHPFAGKGFVGNGNYHIEIVTV